MIKTPLSLVGFILLLSAVLLLACCSKSNNSADQKPVVHRKFVVVDKTHWLVEWGTYKNEKFFVIVGFLGSEEQPSSVIFYNGDVPSIRIDEETQASLIAGERHPNSVWWVIDGKVTLVGPYEFDVDKVEQYIKDMVTEKSINND